MSGLRHGQDVKGACWHLLNESPDGWTDVPCGCTQPVPDPASPCGWCGCKEDVTQHAPGHDHEPETQPRHRYQPTRCLTCEHPVEVVG